MVTSLRGAAPMGLAQKYADTLARDLACRAAWPPVANVVALGDFGLVSGGVFVPLGNVTRDFGVAIERRPESQPARFDFVSRSTRTRRIVGGVDVADFPDEPVEAELRFEFEDAASLVLKAGELYTQEIGNSAAVLSTLRNLPGWRRKYRLVRQVWSCRRALVLSSAAPMARVSLRAKASVLRRVEIGDVDSDVSVSSDSGVGLELIGRGGVLGVGLVRSGWFGGERTRGEMRADTGEGTVDDPRKDVGDDF